MSKLVSFAALVIATGAYMALRKSSSRPPLLLEAPKGKPEPVQTWEGEGGALPVTGSQMGPEPSANRAVDEGEWEASRQGAIPGIH